MRHNDIVGDVLAPDGVQIHYAVGGSGPAVVLLHGISADGEMNWEWTGVAPALREAGFTTIVVDQRGHGRSDKPHDPVSYDDDRFARDVSTVLDDLSLSRCGLVGYSMGAHMALRLVPLESRVTALVLGGIGATVLGAGDREAVARALEVDDPAGLDPGEPKSIREYADITGADRRALAAIQRGRSTLPFRLDAITIRTLVIVGRDDDVVDGARELAAQLPHATLVQVPGDHAGALIEPAFREAIVSFLRSAPR
jgi:pimeloyl-ACP methyl ester carboxylesterase